MRQRERVVKTTCAPRETRKLRKRPRRDERRGRRSHWVWVADGCRDGGWLFVWQGGGLDGFWCVINQQHLPWHCLDRRLRAAPLCCALLPLSAPHLSPPAVCLFVCLCPFSLCLQLFFPSRVLSPCLFLLLLSFLCSFFLSPYLSSLSF